MARSCVKLLLHDYSGANSISDEGRTAALHHSKGVGSEYLLQRWVQEGWYDGSTVGEAFKRGAQDRPEATFVIASEQRPDQITLADLDERSDRIASALAGLGVRHGDVVAVQLPNWLEAILALHATMKLGAVTLPIIHSYGPAEVGFILRQSRASTLIVPDRWRSIDYLARIADLGDIPSIQTVVVVGRKASAGGLLWSELEARGTTAPPSPRISPEDPCLMVYTSGTTAEPKGVIHSHNSLLAELRSPAHHQPGDRDSAFLGCFPAGHIGGLLVQCRLSFRGRKTVLMDSWDPSRAARLIEDHRITDTGGTPFFLEGLLTAAAQTGRDISSLEIYRVSSASVPPSLVERATEAGLLTFRAYGSSEHPTITCGAVEDPLEKRINTDGRIVPGVEVRLIEDDGHDVPEGQPGEIISRGPDLFIGYKDPALNGSAFLDGWFRTGDVAILDPDGYLTITDRKKDIVIRGGENISSKEVEDILSRHPSVVEAAVVGAPDPIYGERVCAFVILDQGAELGLDEVRRHFKAAGVAWLKTPEQLEVCDELPRTAAGKVKKFELRQWLNAGERS